MSHEYILPKNTAVHTRYPYVRYDGSCAIEAGKYHFCLGFYSTVLLGPHFVGFDDLAGRSPD
jgi:hypothetical protein